nr:hypothetical protein BaRGS_033892 [Batillaria attramentaria]
MIRKNTKMIVAVTIPVTFKSLARLVIHLTLTNDNFQHLPSALVYSMDAVFVMCVSLNVFCYTYFSVRVCSAGRQWAAVGGVFILNLLLRALFGMWTIETHNFCSDSDTWLFTNVTELSQFSKDVAFVYMGIELFPLALLLSVNGILPSVPLVRQTVSSMKKEESGKRRNTQLIVAVSVPPILKCLMIQIVNIVLIVDDFNVPVGLRYCKEVAIVLSVSVNVLFYSYFGDRFRKKLREMWETLVHSRSP